MFISLLIDYAVYLFIKTFDIGYVLTLEPVNRWIILTSIMTKWIVFVNVTISSAVYCYIMHFEASSLIKLKQLYKST